ncbi:MAG TPA: LCP family protein [Micromonosporaceae bacterium]|nr:LCP family protein [Micromonosporaceae bacterium]
MMAGVGGIGVRALTAWYDRSLDRRPLLDPTARRQHSTVSGPLNFLVVGWDQGHPDVQPQATSIMVLHVSAGLDRAHLVALPGDLMVDLPRPADSGHPGGADLLVAALDRADGARSAQLLSAALTRLMGVQFDGAAIVDLAAVHRLIDLIGGIELAGAADPPGGAGSVTMDGGHAVDYLRQRRDERHRNHQQVWRATAVRIAEIDLLGNPIKLDQVARAVGSALVVDTNVLGIDDLVGMLRKLRPEQVVGVQLPVRPLTADAASPRVLHAEAEDLSGCLRRGDLARWTRQNPYWVNEL